MQAIDLAAPSAARDGPFGRGLRARRRRGSSKSATTRWPWSAWRRWPCWCLRGARRYPPAGGGGAGVAARPPRTARAGPGQLPGLRRRAGGGRARHGREPAATAPLSRLHWPPGSPAATRWRRSRWPPGAGGLVDRPACRAGPDADPGHHGRRVQLQPVCAEPGGRAGPDAGDDARARRQVRGLRRHPRRVRPHQQPARGACRCSRSASRAPAACRRACATTSARRS
jgi:hypothetical protein